MEETQPTHTLAIIHSVETQRPIYSASYGNVASLFSEYFCTLILIK
jgi:hypothetical protein